MKPGGGKQKGANFERFVSKELSLWVSGGKRDDLFWRSAMSGGRATVGAKQGIIRTTQAGDITALASTGAGAKKAKRFAEKYLVECKSVKTLELHRLLAYGVGFVRRTWDRAILDAEPKEEGVYTGLKTPMLFLNQNGGPVLVVFDRQQIVNPIPNSATSYVRLQFRQRGNITPIGILLHTDFIKLPTNIFF